MKDNFDKLLSNKIKEVTENRDLPYNPEHWKKLVDKKNRRKKRALIYWRVAAFLVLSLFVGSLGKFLLDNPDPDAPIQKELIIGTSNDSLRDNKLKIDEQRLLTESAIDSLKTEESGLAQNDSVKTKSKTPLPYKSIGTENENRITLNEPKKVFADEVISSKDTLIDKKLISVDDLLQKNEKLAQNTEVIEKDSLDDTGLIENLVEQLKKDSLRMNNEFLVQLEEEITNERSKRKPIKIGVNVSPLFNYSAASENSTIGFAGGVSVEIPISGKFDIYTGVMYANQKFNLQEESTYLAYEVSAKGEDQLIAEEATVSGIEIPIALKYNFSIAQKNVFVTAGVSATSNFKENIEADYIVNSRTQSSKEDTFGNSIVQYELVQTNTKVVTSNGSNNINLASILNLSVGMEVPINKDRQSIIVEPYFKYSLTPVTQQKIDYSSAGVFVRYNFAFKRN